MVRTYSSIDTLCLVLSNNIYSDLLILYIFAINAGATTSLCLMQAARVTGAEGQGIGADYSHFRLVCQ